MGTGKKCFFIRSRNAIANSVLSWTSVPSRPVYPAGRDGTGSGRDFQNGTGLCLRWLCHYNTVTTTLSLRLCHYDCDTTTLSLQLCHYDSVTTTLSLRLCHYDCHYDSYTHARANAHTRKCMHARTCTCKCTHVQTQAHANAGTCKRIHVQIHAQTHS